MRHPGQEQEGGHRDAGSPRLGHAVHQQQHAGQQGQRHEVVHVAEETLKEEQGRDADQRHVEGQPVPAVLPGERRHPRRAQDPEQDGQQDRGDRGRHSPDGPDDRPQDRLGDSVAAGQGAGGPPKLDHRPGVVLQQVLDAPLVKGGVERGHPP
jgi:hypothetical protein